jgi:hypothetical protein
MIPCSGRSCKGARDESQCLADSLCFAGIARMPRGPRGLSFSSPLKNVESSAFSVFLSSNSWGDRLVVSAVG